MNLLFRRVRLVAGWMFLAALGWSHSAIEAEPRRNNEAWLQRHLGFAEQARTAAGCELLFLGDSITDHWRRKAVELWDTHYAPHGALNFGISGDRTQHLLWRLQNGGLGQLRPKVVVLMIGTNNLGFNRDGVTPRNTLAEVADGIRANVHFLRHALPETKILLLGIFPRGEAGSALRLATLQVNAAISTLDDGVGIFYLDLAAAFLEPDGSIAEDIMPDLLHPTTQGYERWAAAMDAVLKRLLP